jgi:hypothetical protein
MLHDLIEEIKLENKWALCNNVTAPKRFGQCYRILIIPHRYSQNTSAVFEQWSLHNLWQITGLIRHMQVQQPNVRVQSASRGWRIFFRSEWLICAVGRVSDIKFDFALLTQMVYKVPKMSRVKGRSHAY